MTKRYTGGVVSSFLPTVNAAGASGVFSLSQQSDYQSRNAWPPYKVEESLRFRSSASAYLSRTPASAGNRKTWTWSGWVKRGQLGIFYPFLQANYSGVPWFVVGFANNDKIEITQNAGSSVSWETPAVFRDCSAWYHIVCVVDTTSATSTMNGSATDRFRLYVNGTQYVISGGSVPSQNADLQVNNTVAHTVGGYVSHYGDGYLTEINFIDGQALTPSSFGATDKDGNWSPIAYTGTYGQNGFYLNFKDATSTSTVGYDYSGNGNNWASSGISVTAGTTYDSMIDVPSDQSDGTANNRGNYCTLNPLNKFSGTTVSAGNMKVTHGSSGDGWCTTGSTFAFPETGKWYAEFFITSRAFSGTVGIGISEANRSFVSQSGDTARFAWGRVYFDNASTFIGPSNGTTGSVTNYTTGDTIMLAFDSDNGRVWWGKNGTWYGTGASPDPATGVSAAYTGLTRAAYPMGFVATCEGYSGSITDANFGQRPFTYAPPSGFKTLNTFNLPEPTIKQPNKYFDTTLWTGNGSTQSITGLNFKPDLVWVKVRSSTQNHSFNDPLRGAGNYLVPNATAAERFQGEFTSFNSDGFSVTYNAAEGDYNFSGKTYVGWQWNAGGANTTNTSGSITSIVRANPIAGFSIVSFNSGAAGDRTVGHGLGVTPSVVIMKSRQDSSYNWAIYHSSVCTTTSNYFTFTSSGLNTYATVWGAALPTSTVFGITSGNGNGGIFNNTNCIAYCFAPVDGYSAFGKYTGNGSTDGPFIFTGFRPKFVMIKSTGVEDWRMFDTSRSTYNIQGATLYPNASDAENAGQLIDMNSNGFKCRTTDGAVNGSGTSYIYMAFAEAPFKYARSR